MDAAGGNNGTLYFEAELRPHRSLSRKALWLVLGGMMAGSLYVTTLMYFLGAWPVIGFNGADILLAGCLFWMNTRAARAREIIRLSDAVLEIINISPGGRSERKNAVAGLGAGGAAGAAGGGAAADLAGAGWGGGGGAAAGGDAEAGAGGGDRAGAGKAAGAAVLGGFERAGGGRCGD